MTETTFKIKIDFSFEKDKTINYEVLTDTPSDKLVDKIESEVRFYGEWLSANYNKVQVRAIRTYDAQGVLVSNGTFVHVQRTQ